MADVGDGSFETSYEGSPSQIEKRDNLRLIYDCTVHKSNSFKSDREKWAFACKVEDVMFRLLRFIPSEVRTSLEEHYNEMNDKLEENRELQQPAETREKKMVDIMFQYAKPVHEHNLKLMPMSSQIKRDVEGELDVSKEEILEAIRGGKRTDDKTVSLKQKPI